MLVAWSHPWWKYFNYGNWQILQIFSPEIQVLSINQHNTGSKPDISHPLAWYKESRLFNQRQRKPNWNPQAHLKTLKTVVFKFLIENLSLVATMISKFCLHGVFPCYAGLCSLLNLLWNGALPYQVSSLSLCGQPRYWWVSWQILLGIPLVSALLESKASTSLKFCYPSAVSLVFLLGVAHGPYLVSSLNMRVLGSF